MVIWAQVSRCVRSVTFLFLFQDWNEDEEGVLDKDECLEDESEDDDDDDEDGGGEDQLLLSTRDDRWKRRAINNTINVSNAINAIKEEAAGKS